MTGTIITSERLELFVDALKTVPDEQLVTPPGLGMMKAKWLRRGLNCGALIVHQSGRGYCYARVRTGAVVQWEGAQRMEDIDGPLADPAAIQATLLKMAGGAEQGNLRLEG
jgi:hypothetical protein